MKSPEYYGVKRIPKVGETIYVGGEMYLSHGRDDFAGGSAVVSKVHLSEEWGTPRVDVQIKARPRFWYNWKFLEECQEKLKDTLKDAVAHPDPDDREEFNRWD